MTYRLCTGRKAATARSASARGALMFGTALGVSIAIATAAAPNQALAANECGAVPAGGVIVCTSGGNPYPTGIDYTANAGEDISVVLLGGGFAVDVITATDPGVTATGVANYDAEIYAYAGASVDSYGVGLLATSYGTGDAIVDTEAGVTIYSDRTGIVANAEDTGNAVVVNDGSIAVDGDVNPFAYATGIAAFADGGDVSISTSGAVGVTSFTDAISTGVHGLAFAPGGDVFINSSSAITVSNYTYDAYGITAFAFETVGVFSSGVVDVYAVDDATGILAFSLDNAVVNQSADMEVIGFGGEATGIVAASLTADAVASFTGAYLSVDGFDDALGVAALAYGDATVVVSGDVEVYSVIGTAEGLVADSAAYDALVSVYGDVEALGGVYATGISADGYLTATVAMTGDLTASGSIDVYGIDVDAGTAAGVSFAGAINVNGASDATGIDVYSATTTGSVAMAGTLVVSGLNEDAYGILVDAYTAGSVALAGDIDVFAYEEAAGISVEAGTTASVAMAGNLVVESSDGDATGILADSDDTTTVAFAGAIDIDAYSSAAGIDAYADDNTVSVAVSTTTMTVDSVDDEAVGIRAESADDSASVSFAGAMTVNGNDDAEGIYVDTGSLSIGDVYVNGTLTVDSVNGAAYGINVEAGAAEVDVIGDITATGYDDTYGIYVDTSTGDGDIAVAGNIIVDSSAEDVYGIYVEAETDAIVAVTGDITATAFGSAYGIYAQGDDYSVTVTMSGNISAISATEDAIGIGADAETTATIGVTGDIAVTGDLGAIGIDIEGDEGIDVAMAGNIAATATYAANGMDLFSDAGAVAVGMTGDITAVSTQQDANGLDVYAYLDADVTFAGNIVASAYYDAVGIEIDTGPTGVATVAFTGDISATGAENGAQGMEVNGDAGAYVTMTGDLDIGAYGGVLAASGDAYGLNVQSAYGAVTVALTGDATVFSDNYEAFGVFADGDDAVSVTVVGDLDIDAYNNATGVEANSATGTTSINVTGNVYVTSDDVQAFGLYVNQPGDIDVVMAGDIVSTSPGSAYGMYLISDGYVTVDMTGDILATSTASYVYGIDIYADGGALVDMDGDIFANAFLGSKGIEIDTDTLGTATVDFTGDITAVSAETYAAGMAIYGDAGVLVNMTGDLDVRAYGDALYGSGDATGMDLESVYGGVTVNFTGDAFVFSDNYDAFGININAEGDVSVAMAGDMTVSAADFAAGVNAVSDVGDIFVNVGGSIDVYGGQNAYGVYVIGDYYGSVVVFGDIDAYSPGFLAYGVDINVDGDAYMFIDGDVYAGGSQYNTGLDIDSGDGFATTRVYGDITVTGPAATGFALGISTNSELGTYVTVEGDIDVYGYQGATGIEAFSDDDVYVDVEGSIEADSAYAAYGIRADALDDVFVYVDGDIDAAGGTNGEAIHVDAGDFAFIDIDGGYIYGSDVGIHSTSVSGTDIENGGVIYSGTGLAIDVDGGAADIGNYGVIYGYVDLTANSDYLYNAGVWEAYGYSDFGGLGLDADLVVNTGIVGFSRYQGAASTTTFADLEYFNNYGIVSGVDDQVDDYLVISGEFFGGAGSELHLDVELGGPGSLADVLVIGEASGVTEIVPNDQLAGGFGVLNFGGILVVDSGNGAEAGTEFVMDNVDKGFVEYELFFDAAGDDWFIVGLPDDEAFELLVAPAAAQQFWLRSADAVSARWQEIRDVTGAQGSMSAGPGDGYGRAEGWELWMQAHAGDEGFDDIETFDIGGFTFVQDLSHDSDWRGFQFGVDNLTGNMLYGFTMGFVQQETRFDFDNNSFDFEGWNVGGYVGWASNGFFFNGLLKGDFYEVDGNFTSVPTYFTFDGTTWGVRGELGYRFGGNTGWFVEPVGSLAWSSTDLDSFTTAGATVDFGDNDSLLGKIGVRLGGTYGHGSSVVWTPYIGVHAIEELEGENDMTFATGPVGFTIQDTPPEGYGQVEFGFTAQTFYGLEGFLKGEWNFGDDADGGAGRLGVRWRW